MFAQEAVRSFERELSNLESAGVLALSEAQRRAVADYHRGLLADAHGRRLEPWLTGVERKAP